MNLDDTTSGKDFLPGPPKIPRPSAILASLLEVQIVMSLFVLMPSKAAVFGVVSCAGYAWFSATRYVVGMLFSSEDE